MEIEEARSVERPGPAPRFPDLVAQVDCAVLIAVRTAAGRSGWYQVMGIDEGEAASIQARLWDMNRRTLSNSACRVQSRRVGRIVKFRAILRRGGGRGKD